MTNIKNTLENLYQDKLLTRQGFYFGEDWISKKRSMVKKVLLASRVTKKVILQAVENGIELIVSIYPPKFTYGNTFKIKQTEREILKLLMQNKIAIYTLGEDWVYIKGGGLDYFLTLLQFDFKQPFGDNDNLKIGRFGQREKKIKFKELLQLIQSITNEDIRYAGYHNKQISNIAIFFNEIHSEQDVVEILDEPTFDLVVFTDIKYDALLRLDSIKFPYIIIPQRELENCFLGQVRRKLTEELTLELPEIILFKQDKIGTILKH